MSTDNPTIANEVNPFFQLLSDAANQGALQRLILSKYIGAEEALKRLVVRPLLLREVESLSFVYSYQTRDITRNHPRTEGLALLATLLGSDFKSAHLFTQQEEVQLNITKKGKAQLHRRASAASAEVSHQHDREKRRFVPLERPFLVELGVTDRQHQLIPAMSRKWKQINKFIEVFQRAFDASPLQGADSIEVYDFGSGKGYLTFAIHDFLRHSRQLAAEVTGVELRQPLINLCTTAAKRLGLEGLTFRAGDVRHYTPARLDVMIALHACDTATDHAIHMGIRSNAAIIMCAPCCHKEVRPQMHNPAVLQPMLQYGVHQGQEAEMVTDALRALLLEANGYDTQVFEFVSLEHTSKNKMILAVRRNQPGDAQPVLAQIAALKQFYGIREQCLESLLLGRPDSPDTSCPGNCGCQGL
ncbi:MAG: SAM-dependent methyltransferase [Gammaproteobacteria bacterium]|nr:SAM-dependent methyltransferase [Gammaproteobacteria bacterium]